MRLPAFLLPAILLFGALAFVGCGGVDGSKLQDEIKKEVEASGGRVTEVSCPDDQELKRGTSFNCTATTADGREVPIKMTITSEDDGGRVEYVIPPQLVVPQQ